MDQSGISSENEIGKRSRGRPPRIDPMELAQVWARYRLHVTSRRGAENKLYMQRAIDRLLDEERRPRPEYAWLFEGKEMKLTLLSKLGRITDDDLFFKAADDLCAKQPTTRAGLRIIVEKWIEQRRRGDPLQLAKALVNLIAHYRRTNLYFTDEDLNQAFAAMLAQGDRIWRDTPDECDTTPMPPPKRRRK